MEKAYNKINPKDYIDEIGGEQYPDYNRLVGVPIKLGRDMTTRELFDDITKQLINDGLVEVSSFEDKTLISYRDESEGIPISRVVEDKGEGVMVTFNENGSLSPYEEPTLETSDYTQDAMDHNEEYDEEYYEDPDPEYDKEDLNEEEDLDEEEELY